MMKFTIHNIQFPGLRLCAMPWIQTYIVQVTTSSSLMSSKTKVWMGIYLEKILGWFELIQQRSGCAAEYQFGQ
jgi:hypothetical protein